MVAAAVVVDVVEKAVVVDVMMILHLDQKMIHLMGQPGVQQVQQQQP